MIANFRCKKGYSYRAKLLSFSADSGPRWRFTCIRIKRIFDGVAPSHPKCGWNFPQIHWWTRSGDAFSVVRKSSTWRWWMMLHETVDDARSRSTSKFYWFQYRLKPQSENNANLYMKIVSFNSVIRDSGKVNMHWWFLSADQVQNEKLRFWSDETRRFVRAQSRCDVPCCCWCWAHASSSYVHLCIRMHGLPVKAFHKLHEPTHFFYFFRFLQLEIMKETETKRQETEGTEMAKKEKRHI